MTPEIEALLGGYAAGTLTNEEHETLLGAALRDDEVFAALAAELPLRDLLRDEAVRRELLTALERPRHWVRLPTWMPTPRPGLIAAVGTLAVVVGLLWLGPWTYHTEPDTSGPPWPSPAASPRLPVWPGMAPVWGPDETSARAVVLRELFGLPVRQTFGARFSLSPETEPARFAVGTEIRLAFTVDRESNVIVLERRPDGSVEELFPNPSSPFPRAKAGVVYRVPALAKPPLELTEPLGSRTLRLVAFPPGTDPTALSSPELRLVERDLTVVDVSYEVVRSRP